MRAFAEKCERVRQQFMDEGQYFDRWTIVFMLAAEETKKRDEQRKGANNECRRYFTFKEWSELPKERI